MSGTGKTTVLDELARRGHDTVDTDHDGWVRADGDWDVARMTRLLDNHDALAVAGTVANQGDFYNRFEHVVLLSAPLDVLLHRVASRTSNPYGRTAADRTRIGHHLRTVEPQLRAGATLELDARRPVVELADTVAQLIIT